MKRNTEKNVISITFLTLLILSLCSPILPVFSEDNGPEGGDDAPTVYVIDYENGTTRMIKEYADGSSETFTQTLLVQTLVEVPGEAPEIVSKPLPDAPSIMGLASVGPEEVIDLYTQKEVLMGFTHHLTWSQSDGESYAVYRWNAYVQVNFHLGLRYPVRITLQYPNVMTEETDHVFNAKVTPLDWSGYDELLLTANYWGYFHSEYWAFGWWTDEYHEYSDSYDYSLSYPTPVGDDMTIPLVPPIGDTFFESDLFDLAYEIFPQIGSDKITAQVTTAGDAIGNQNIQFEQPEEWVPFTIHADDHYGPTDYAQVSLSDFRYYFSLFNVQILLHIDCHDWLEEWIGDPSIVVFMWDWSETTEDAYLPIHEGWDGTMTTPWIFVQYFGMDLSVSPGTVSIEPGYWGTYTATVTNTGNVQDEFDIYSVDQPANWEYMFSPSSVSMNPGESKNLQVSIKPWRHCSVAPGDYPITVWGQSIGAAEWGLVRRDSDDTIVHVLPFYEVDMWINPLVSTVKPRETASYKLVVRNKGNVPDSFDFTTEYPDFGDAYRAYPTAIQPGWVDIVPDPIGPINPCRLRRSDLTILVPGEWAGMEDSTYDFDVTATSVEDLTHIPPASDTESDELTIEATKESMVRYIALEVEWLTAEVEAWPGKEDIRDGLLDKLAAAINKYPQTLDNIFRGRDKQANNMLKAWMNIMEAFIKLNKAQYGKGIEEPTADDWMAQAEQIIEDIQLAMETPIE